MDVAKRNALEAAGFAVGDAGDFLGLDDAERRLVELRVATGRAVRRHREARGLTQSQVAAMIRSTQPGLARIEAAARNVSLDQMARALDAVGGDIALVSPEVMGRVRSPGSRSEAPEAVADADADKLSRPGVSPKRRRPKTMAE